MLIASAIKGVGLLVGVILLGFGVWFGVAPDAALAGTSHQLELLPYVMGGRYAFFGAMLIAALLYDDSKVTAVLLAGFAGLALFDTVLYLGADPVPHFAVGILAAAACFYFYKNRKSAA